MEQWSTQWIDELKEWLAREAEKDPEGEPPMKLFPLQLINCRRLEHNEAVYIFDEVGCGKTISAGLMALHYLYNNPRDVLVITENLVRKQFWNDWVNRLPFQKEDWGNGKKGFIAKDATYYSSRDRVRIVANLEKHIEAVWEDESRFGMIIIDEAHRFLRPDNVNYKKLMALKNRPQSQKGDRFDKVVFLTATPMKTDAADLDAYVKIAKGLLKDDALPRDWIEIIKAEREETTILCSRFDPLFPATRYFKDTAQNLQEAPPSQTRRCLAHVWEYDYDEAVPGQPQTPGAAWLFGTWEDRKLAALVRNIRDVMDHPKKERTDRFIIFVCQVDGPHGVFAVEEYLREHLTAKDSRFPKGERDVLGIWSGNQDRLRDICAVAGTKGLTEQAKEVLLPRILVINYQLGECGFNLPDYNYVINYHISAFPASLEQRFGRIDRLTSQYQEIYMCYLVRNWQQGYLDQDTKNFYEALREFYAELLLPAKNVILNDTRVQRLFAGREKALADNQELLSLLTGPERNRALQECELAWQEGGWKPDYLNRPENYMRLVTFCRREGLRWPGASEEMREAFVHEVERRLRAQRENLLGTGQLAPKDGDWGQWKNDLEKAQGMSDKILYSFRENSAVREGVKFLDPVKECAATIQEKMKKWVAQEKARLAGERDPLVEICDQFVQKAEAKKRPSA